jgi:hypothetical protein
LRTQPRRSCLKNSLSFSIANLVVTGWRERFGTPTSKSRFTTIIFRKMLKTRNGWTGAGKKNWIVVTRDERIRYRVAEKQAIRERSCWLPKGICAQKFWQKSFCKRCRRFGEW